MYKKVLSEIALYYGNINMPEDWDIDREKLSQDILISILFNKEFTFSKTWDMLNTYMKDHIRIDHRLRLINRNTWGNIYKPNEITTSLSQIDPVDLKNSPDFVCLYGVKVNECNVKIYFDDNRKKGKLFDIPLTDNSFIMFPSTNVYYITNNQKDSLNFIQTITYESV
jgi:hypothetical protein